MSGPMDRRPIDFGIAENLVQNLLDFLFPRAKLLPASNEPSPRISADNDGWSADWLDRKTGVPVWIRAKTLEELDSKVRTRAKVIEGTETP